MTHVLLATTVESGNRRFRARIVLREVFFASIFVAHVKPNLFFRLRMGKFSSAAPINEGTQGFWSGARGGGGEVSTMLVWIGTLG